jgi:hypothetical protein
MPLDLDAGPGGAISGKIGLALYHYLQKTARKEKDRYVKGCV